MRYGNFSYSEARNLPIYKVRWYIERINQENKKDKEQQEKMFKSNNKNVEGLPAQSGFGVNVR